MQNVYSSIRNQRLELLRHLLALDPRSHTLRKQLRLLQGPPVNRISNHERPTLWIRLPQHFSSFPRVIDTIRLATSYNRNPNLGDLREIIDSNRRKLIENRLQSPHILILLNLNSQSRNRLHILAERSPKHPLVRKRTRYCDEATQKDRPREHPSLKTTGRCASGTPQAADQLGISACEFQPDVAAERQTDDVSLLVFGLGLDEVCDTVDGVVEGEGY